jgi:hypothetical protein
MVDVSKLKQGEYYGYYDENGNWITGQNGRNPLPPGWTDEALDAAIARLKFPFSKESLLATWKEIKFVFAFSQKSK